MHHWIALLFHISLAKAECNEPIMISEATIWQMCTRLCLVGLVGERIVMIQSQPVSDIPRFNRNYELHFNNTDTEELNSTTARSQGAITLSRCDD